MWFVGSGGTRLFCRGYNMYNIALGNWFGAAPLHVVNNMTAAV